MPSKPPLNLAPTISKADGIKRLTLLMQRGEEIVAGTFTEPQAEVWREQCEGVIRAAFGAHTNYVNTFYGPIFVTGGTTLREVANLIKRRCGVLKDLIEALKLELVMSGESGPQVDENSFWNDIHPEIREVARSRYESAHFADAVEASLKHVEVVVKKIFVAAGKSEMIGAALMRSALSPTGGVIVLEDLATQDGKNIQQGYMEMMAGAMTGIRNPKAHGNIVIDAKRARHHIYTASLFAYVIDERKP